MRQAIDRQAVAGVAGCGPGGGCASPSSSRAVLAPAWIGAGSLLDAVKIAGPIASST